jgi:hypothetical protein
MYRQILKVTLALLITIFSSQAHQASAQSALPGHGQNSHPVLAEGTAASSGSHQLILTAFSLTDREPLLLLLFGLAVFLGATTVKRRNSDLR